jgi:hypothetical protein
MIPVALDDGAAAVGADDETARTRRSTPSTR